MKTDPHAARRFRCRQKDCPNTYTDVIGGDQSFGKVKRGADCLPCFYAALLHENGQAPEAIESVPAMLQMFEPHLREAGWSWADVKSSFARHPVLR